MNELNFNKQTMSSLEIAELTGKQHAHVMEAIRVMEPAWLKLGQSNFRLTSYTDQCNRQQPMFELTKTECLYVATKFNDEARAALVLRWEALETGNATPVVQRELSRKELAMMVIQAEEEKERLALENKRKEEHIAKIQPKADFADAAFQSEGKVDIGQAAKILKLPFGRNKLFAKLKEVGVFFANRNEPKQKYIDAGYFEMTLLPPIHRKNHPDLLVQKVLCLPKGLAYINHLFGGNPTTNQLSPIR